jgi:hypothetical protein
MTFLQLGKDIAPVINEFIIRSARVVRVHEEAAVAYFEALLKEGSVD